MISVIFLYLGFSVSFILMKASLFYSEPFFLVAIRMIPASLILFGYSFFKKKLVRIPRKDFFYFGLATIFNIFITNTFELLGMEHATSSHVSLVFCFAPFLGALLSYFVWGERLTRLKWVGLMLGIGGLGILICPTFFCQNMSVAISNFYLFGAMIASTIGWTAIKILVFNRNYSGCYVNSITMFIGGLLSLLASCMFETIPYAQTLRNSNVLLLVGGTIIITCIICYNLYAWLLRYFSVVFMTFAGFLAPLMTAVLGWFFLHEPLHLTFFVSFAILLTGLVVFYLEEVKK